MKTNLLKAKLKLVTILILMLCAGKCFSQGVNKSVESVSDFSGTWILKKTINYSLEETVNLKSPKCINKIVIKFKDAEITLERLFVCTKPDNTVTTDKLTPILLTKEEKLTPLLTMELLIQKPSGMETML